MMDHVYTAVVLAAGQGKRMRSNVQKQFLMLGDKPVLYYSLACFERTEFIRDIVLVTGRDLIDFCKREVVDRYHLKKVVKIVPGGKERYDSVYEGLLACEGADYVFIHDGARPFVTPEILERARDGAVRYGACVVGMPSKDTVKLVDGEHCVAETPDRQKVWMVQTPQVFRCDLIRGAHEQMRGGDMSGVTDDAMVVERFGNCRVKMVEGSYQNIKITTPDDLMIARSFLDSSGVYETRGKNDFLY